MNKTNTNTKQAIKIKYKNWKGNERIRHIIPEKIYYGKTEWHPTEGWLLVAYDLDKKAERHFSMKDISGWKEST